MYYIYYFEMWKVEKVLPIWLFKRLLESVITIIAESLNFPGSRQYIYIEESKDRGAKNMLLPTRGGQLIARALHFQFHSIFSLCVCECVCACVRVCVFKRGVQFAPWKSIWLRKQDSQIKSPNFEHEILLSNILQLLDCMCKIEVIF